MGKYKFREPDYVGFWNTSGDSRSSVFIAYVGQRISDGKWLVERGRMIDSVGVIKFETGHDSHGKLHFQGAYIPDLSGGCSRKIKCDLSAEEDFVKGTWHDRRSSGEFAATRFDSAFICNNPSMQLLFANEYDKLGRKLVELTQKFPFSPPIPAALEEIR